MHSLELMKQYLPALLKALPTTLYLLFISVFFALILGFFLAWAEVGRIRPLKGIAGVFISFMRGTPMLVQILLIFILIPMIAYQNGVDTNNWNPSLYAIVAFSLNESAFFAEIFRSAYLSLDRGQMEAAESLGMNKWQLFRRVIFPQAAASALPNTTNMILELMKNTSIAMVIGVYDIMGKAVQLGKNNYGVGQKELYIEVAVIFWVMGLIILSISNIISDHLNKGNASYRRKGLFS
ncbi:MAG: amino acid ABC transporter permease [Oscillospiraceae bacterium]|nr:amino acid ABC transporter permease [Oscillospiraceae bacterium]